jgi:hypothetical protein
MMQQKIKDLKRKLKNLGRKMKNMKQIRLTIVKEQNKKSKPKCETTN